jgi:hypothetical protein
MLNLHLPRAPASALLIGRPQSFQQYIARQLTQRPGALLIDAHGDLAAVLKSLVANTRERPSLIVRDLSTRMMPLLPGDPWFTDARGWSDTFNTSVLTVGHCGPMPMGNPLEYGVDAVFLVEQFHDKERQSSLNVKIRRVLPVNGPTLELAGHAVPSGVVFRETAGAA